MTAHATREHILVLSDAEDVLTVIRELLEDEGYRVTVDAYLTGNVASVKKASPDAILIDCNRMELEESVSYLREIRALPHLRDTPIIASTSAVRIIDNYQPQVEELGLRILRKPFDIEKLAEVVAESLDERPPAHA